MMHYANTLEGRSTEMVQTPINRMGAAEEVASLIAFLLSDESKFISGACYAIDGAVSIVKASAGSQNTACPAGGTSLIY